MTITLHPEAQRGQADYGWLKARYSFSFAGYYDENNIHFGALRVLNDDIVAPGMGFGTHPHDNMEIITIPLEGSITHRDSMGNEGTITEGEIQVMSAGTGITHSEMNGSSTNHVKLLQIWIFPQYKQVAPRYQQMAYHLPDNAFVNLVTPFENTASDALWIYQQAYIHLGIFTIGSTTEYQLKNRANGVYLFLIEGHVNLNGQTLTSKDAASITNTDVFYLKMEAKSKILVLELPLL
jgi:redox-sensitive bicupin YhaK (pirin superfamily)